VGSCAVHHVFGFKAYQGPIPYAIADEEMIPVSCCEVLDDMARQKRVHESWLYCPWCGIKR
jgi:hypothetical protein